MIINLRRARSSRRGRFHLSGMTLVELTIVIGMMVLLAGLGMGLLSQQVTMAGIIKERNFLVSKAPQVNNMLGRVIQRADRFMIFDDIPAAQAGTQGSASGNALVLVFRDAVGNKQFGMIAAELNKSSGEVELNYYFNGSGRPGDKPLWKIAGWNAPANGENGVTFEMFSGVLETRLVGPLNEEIVYAASAAL
ncbi:hypothetical protein [Persicirhabdus sediminis]|uniref:Prepilin-type N-terminal cleavage/methylation domain-containing protein n=1 Tax=Persicirhabdus sediminis TaxID=454144 RepID=A0A8J7SH21_9BACT|nr:hypothetical protein [Persicirhabdus sediminis]MBK1789581.1 hypothetical protein [Persicirhabdus sediminis]